jgi:integrator complex subunit 1
LTAYLQLSCTIPFLNFSTFSFCYRIKDGEAAKCPPPENIPAITAVVQDARLFRALLRCLQSTGSLGGDSEVLERQISLGTSLPLVASRKRSLSLTADPERMPSKSTKLTHSPVPGTRHKVPQAGKRKSTWNVPAMVATILYTAFQHLDHWPAPLIKAYADDCFGPRLWVDDDRCKLLVDNLALVHCREPAQAVEQKIRDASTVTDAYRKFELTSLDEQEDPDPDVSFPSLQHRGSMSSTGSGKLHRSASRDSADNSVTNEQAYGDDSNSGDEEECVLDSAVRNNAKLDDGDDSSSGEEDEEVVVTNKSNGKESMDAVPESQGSAVSTSLSASTNGVDAMQLSPKANNVYPITQSNLDVTRVRQRFFGENILYAYDLISSSLLDRLDVKSKQNSGLLQSLPAFTPIPGVRFLIASSLEKWLQSPALAGLARFLFSSTVNQMKNVDPPLEEDLKTIDAVLAMKLKANQVSPAM